METKLVRVPFNVETTKRIMNGEIEGKVITRSGNNVRILCFDKKGDIFPIVALVEKAKDIESCERYMSDGLWSEDRDEESSLDLILEIPEYLTFKDGDILLFENGKIKSIFIYHDIIDRKDKGFLPNYAELRIEEHKDFVNFERSSYLGTSCRLATNEERRYLLSYIKKLKTEYLKFFAPGEVITHFKKKDWVLTTGVEGGEWTLCQYSHLSALGKHVFVGGTRSNICIPYNEKTEHLIGTTEKWEE